MKLAEERRRDSRFRRVPDSMVTMIRLVSVKPMSVAMLALYASGLKLAKVPAIEARKLTLGVREPFGASGGGGGGGGDNGGGH